MFNWKGLCHLEPGDPGFSGHPDDVALVKAARREMEAARAEERARQAPPDRLTSDQEAVQRTWLAHIDKRGRGWAKTVIEVVAERMLRERESVLAEVNKLSERVDQLDGTRILQSSAAATMAANLSALREHANGILHRRAVVIEGEPSELLAEVSK